MVLPVEDDRAAGDPAGVEDLGMGAMLTSEWRVGNDTFWDTDRPTAQFSGGATVRRPF